MNWLRDILALCGAGMILFGLSLWSHALAFVAGGSMLIVGAFLWAIIRRPA